MISPHIHIVASRFNFALVMSLVEGAQHCLHQSDATITPVIHWVSGAFELPLMATKIVQLANNTRFLHKESNIKCDGIIALGVVVRGDTPHFDYVCQGCTQGIMHLMTSHAIPIGFGVVMANTLAQAQQRCSLNFVSSASHNSAPLNELNNQHQSNKGFEAAKAVLQSLESFGNLLINNANE